MRPAWLPAQPSTSQSPSVRDGASPRPGSRPRSAATTPPRDAMIHSARQLLSDDTPPPQKASVATANGEDETVSLRDFMDSFPLVPLAIIPRLGLADLAECETGLLALYQSLNIETNDDDAQLAKYVARQLGLVQRHVEQARARDRVFKLLSGEVSLTLSSITAVHSSSNNNSNNSSSSKTLPVFLQPSPVANVRAAVPVKPPHQPALVQAKSTSSLMGSSKPVNQLAKAKALAKASTTTAFVITTSESSLKARQKKKRALQKSKKSVEEERAMQHEREKEKRRQAAYQRLIARQELQAKKKEEALAKKHRGRDAADGGRVAGVEVGVADVTASPRSSDAVTEKADDNDASSSDESDVSNCSETDAANEQAILEMPVVVTSVQTPEEDEETKGGEDGSVVVDEDTDIEEATEDESHEAKLKDDDERIEGSGEDTVNESACTKEGGAGGDCGVEQPEVEGDDEDHDETTAVDPVEEEVVLTPAELEQQTRDSIASELQRFVAERTQSALEQLRNRHAEDPPALPSARHHHASHTKDDTVPSRPATACGVVSPQQPTTTTTALTTESTTLATVAVPSPTATSVKTRPPPPVVKRKPPQQHSALSRPLAKNVQDYRGYFANFFCILTSVFEQRVAFASAAANNNNQTYLLASATANASNSGDQALRLQLKLYQSWQTIMNDYATVFGNTTSSPFSASASNASSPSTAHYRINSHSRKEVSDIVVTALEKLGNWEEHASGLGLKTTWNLLWTWSKPNVERKTLLAWQRVNHFQHAKALTRKDCLKKNIGKYLALGSTRLKQAYDIIPASFLLPQEYVAFVQAFQERAKSVLAGKNIWIMKPVALSRGRGISLVNDLSQVVYGEQVVIQEYIANPLLLDGFKFDLRLYVLVTSFNPLEAFFYEEGFVRMCTRAYEDSDLTNLFIHLTNSSIQKENQDAIAANPNNPINSAQADAEAGGTKMTLAYLWKRLEAMGADVTSVKNEILSVILKSLLCGEDHIPFQVNSFDLYGYDILLDTNFRPWLIEINSSPSMARENDLDFQVKDALIYDTLKLVNPLHFDRSKLVDVLSRRFQEAETDKKRSHTNTLHPKDAEELAARQLNEDLTEILLGQVPRAYGEMPEHTGSYSRLAPHTPIFNRLVKLKKSCLRLDRK